MYLIFSGCGQGDRGGVSIGDRVDVGTSSKISFFSSSVIDRASSSMANSSLVFVESSFSQMSSASSSVKPMHLVSAVGKCLEIKLDVYLEPEEGGQLWSWDCYSKSSNQHWYLGLRYSSFDCQKPPEPVLER